MDTFSFWDKDLFPDRHDLIVVGAGIVGLSSALFFKDAHPDRSVLVLERGQIPRGASTRNAGFACIGSVTEHRADLERTSEAEVKARIKRRFEGLRLLKRTLGERAIAYEPCGGFELFTSEETYEKAAVDIERLNGWLEELVDEPDVYSPETLNGFPVIRNRLEGALHPGAMMRTLIQKVQDAGVRIRWNSQVTKIDGNEVLLDDGNRLSARHTLLAANGFVQKLMPELSVTPGRGYIFVTDPVDDLAWRGIFHHDRGYVYFRNVGNRLLLGGARNLAEEEEKTDEFGVNPTIKDHLVRFADEILQLPSGWKIGHEWSGIMGFTETKTPILKTVDDYSTVAAGLSGMGIAIGMEVGRQAAGLLSSKFI